MKTANITSNFETRDIFESVTHESAEYLVRVRTRKTKENCPTAKHSRLKRLKTKFEEQLNEDCQELYKALVRHENNKFIVQTSGNNSGEIVLNALSLIGNFVTYRGSKNMGNTLPRDSTESMENSSEVRLKAGEKQEPDTDDDVQPIIRKPKRTTRKTPPSSTTSGIKNEQKTLDKSTCEAPPKESPPKPKPLPPPRQTLDDCTCDPPPPPAPKPKPTPPQTIDNCCCDATPKPKETPPKPKPKPTPPPPQTIDNCCCDATPKPKETPPKPKPKPTPPPPQTIDNCCCDAPPKPKETPPKPKPAPPTPPPTEIVKCQAGPKPKKKKECVYCQNRFCKFCAYLVPRSTLLVQMTDIDNCEEKPMEKSKPVAPKKERKPRTEPQPRERKTKADSGDEDFCSCCGGGGGNKRSNVKQKPKCTCSDIQQPPIEESTNNIVVCQQSQQKIPEPPQPKPIQTCSQTPSCVPPEKSNQSIDDCKQIKSCALANSSQTSYDNKQTQQKNAPQRLEKKTSSRTKQSPSNRNYETDDGSMQCVSCSSSKKCTQWQQPLVAADVKVTKNEDCNKNSPVCETMNLKITEMLNKMNAIQQEITRQKAENKQVKVLEAKIVELNKTIEDMKKANAQLQDLDPKCIDKRCQLKCLCDKKFNIPLRQYMPKSTSSICINCRNKGSGGLLESNMQCVVLRMIDDLMYSDVMMTVLLQADNIYHINVRTLRGKSLGCIYATDEAITEAQKFNLFDDILTFLVIDARNTIRTKDKVFGNAFEFVHENRQQGGFTHKDLKLLYDIPDRSFLNHSDSSQDYIKTFGPRCTLRSEEERKQRLTTKLSRQSVRSRNKSAPYPRTYCIKF